jgi:hypothetical protein
MARSITTILSLGFAGVMTLSAATPSLARDRHVGERAGIAAGVGLAAGALGYGDDYAYAPGYGYAPGYRAYYGPGYRAYYGAAPRYDSDGVAISPSPFCPYGAALQDRC